MQMNVQDSVSVVELGRWYQDGRNVKLQPHWLRGDQFDARNKKTKVSMRACACVLACVCVDRERFRCGVSIDDGLSRLRRRFFFVSF